MRPDRPELQKCAANYVPLTPISYLRRAATIFADRTAVIHGQRRFSYREFYGRARRLAHALSKTGIKRGDTVAILAANTPALLEAHYSVPMIGAVLNPINVRLDPATIAFCLDHGGAHVFFPHREFHPPTAPALRRPARQASVAPSMRSSWRRGTPNSHIQGRTTNGSRSACFTPQARPATRKVRF